MRDGDVARAIDFIGIGAARSGTSWLVNVLRSHPQICVSEPKEVHYFNRHMSPTGRHKGRQNPNFGRSLSWYHAHFGHAAPGQLCGEFTNLYFWDEAAPAAMHERLPKVRLILSLRNPLDRAYSHFWYNRARGVHSIPSFEQALRADIAYAEMSLYARQLKRYLVHFDRSQLLVLIFEELLTSPVQELERLLRFLGVRADQPLDLAQDTNEVVALRSVTARRIGDAVLRTLADRGRTRFLARLRKIGVLKLWHALLAKETRYPPLTSEARREFESYFSSDVAELERLLGRDLQVWRVGAGPR